MSQFDETNFDEDEIQDLFEDEESMTPEDVFKMVMINKVKGTTVHVELYDQDEDKVELSEVIEELLNYIEKKLSDDEANQFVDQIMPLMAQSVVSGLGRMLGIRHTAFFLANETSRVALVNMMSIAFLLLKFVQQKNLTIQTFEKEISEEEIEDIERKAKAGSAATMGALLGMDPKEILENLVEQGEISQDDLEAILDGEDE
ncbi:hypothetical protein CMI41_01165 [Candidatus Pacearchaeota archaeon]|nr:hypothetical protein [Candidatus Pacearchaeota archaeon]|tara:strand:- start:7355 stop:7960 length:606 start_codon:yes stop_codon:yes gene_type:complete